MKEIKDSKIRIKRNTRERRDYDTLGITMELEKSVRIDTEVEKEKQRIKEKIRHKIIKNIIILAVIIFFASILGFFIWLSDTYKNTEYASHYMISTKTVQVDKKSDSLIDFIPKKNPKNIGIIIYPGQKIAPKSYSRLSQMLANDGYRVYVPKLRLNFSPFSKNLADKIIDSNSSIKDWYLIGHSTSGDAALKEAANQKRIQGVIFLGSYPSGDDLKLINKPVLSLWGTKDGLLDLSKYSEYKNNLPQNAHFHEIIGGNNSNFADIETIPNDNKSLISAGQQQEQAVNEIISFIKSSEKLKN